MNIKITNLTHKYSQQTVIDDISLDLKNVSSIGIIGASGCGKSTLARILSGIENPLCGQVLIDDLSPILSKKDFQKNIGYVFQKHNLFPHLTIKQNLMLVMNNIKKIDKKTCESKIDSLLNEFKLLNEINKKPNEISGGQSQRASIARAICTDPKILFLDEPTASLDPLLTNEVLNTVKNLKQGGSQFIFITHEMEFLRDFADYVIFMDNGKIIEHGYIDILNCPNTDKLNNFLNFNV